MKKMYITPKDQKEYRTEDQFIEIFENAYNGNWSTAFQNCVDYGFYANDLIIKQEEMQLFDDEKDLCILTEGAERIRHQK